MVVLDATSIGCTTLIGSPYAQGAPALKIIPKRYLGVHQWLSPIATKDLKEQIVSVNLIYLKFMGLVSHQGSWAERRPKMNRKTFFGSVSL